MFQQVRVLLNCKKIIPKFALYQVRILIFLVRISLAVDATPSLCFLTLCLKIIVFFFPLNAAASPWSTFLGCCSVSVWANLPLVFQECWRYESFVKSIHLWAAEIKTAPWRKLFRCRILKHNVKKLVCTFRNEERMWSIVWVAFVWTVSACHNVLLWQYFSWPFFTTELDNNENTGWDSLHSKEQTQIGCGTGTRPPSPTSPRREKRVL